MPNLSRQIFSARKDLKWIDEVFDALIWLALFLGMIIIFVSVYLVISQMP